MERFANFARSTLDSGIASGDGTLDVTAGDGARFPEAPFRATVWNATDFPDAASDPDREIVIVTDITGDVLTLTRGQEATPDADHNTVGKVYGIVAAPTALQLAALTRPLGVRVPLVYDSANFTLSDYEGGGTWNVPDDNDHVWYAIIGGLAFVQFSIAGFTSIVNSVAPEDELRIILPDALMPSPSFISGGAQSMSYSHTAIDSGAWKVGGVNAQDLSGIGDGPAIIAFTINPDGTGAWPDGGVRIIGQLVFPLRTV
jgi:hypothetical protein